MKRLVVVECGFCWSPASDSGSGSSGDMLMQNLVKLMNELADSVERGPDQSKYDAMSAEINEKLEKLKALQSSEADTKKLTEKYKDEMAKAGARLSRALLKMEEKVLAGVKVPDFGGLLGQEAQKK